MNVKMWKLATAESVILSVGLERIDDLTEDLEQALKRL